VRRFFLLLIFAVCGGISVIALGVARSPTLSVADIRDMVAGVFFSESVTPEGLRARYASASEGKVKVRVLIVPGHDDASWGAEFRGVREANMTAALGEELTRFLSDDPAYQPILLRSRLEYAPGFLLYLEQEKENIRAFAAEKRKVMRDVTRAGSVQRKAGVIHNAAPSEVAEKLYAVNRWASTNQVDIILRLHFNDYPGRRMGRVGRYDGFSMYVPERQFSNARASRAVAESLFEQFSAFHYKSNLPIEEAGIVEDQELIAVGAHNTADSASVLIEYGYIYEPSFLEAEVREVMIKELAFQTYLGLNRFFGKPPDTPQKYPTTLLPHTWNDSLESGLNSSPHVLSLQAALLLEGLYPPLGESKRDCPLTGNFGTCTARAVKDFQKKKGLPVSGTVGKLTLQKLNELYSR
jgi:N-acetylmuramoyl-L-alanine amidase